MSKHFRRSRQLVRPGTQWRLLRPVFMVLIGSAVLQSILTGYSMNALARSTTRDSDLIKSMIVPSMLENAMLSLLLTVPAMLVLGVAVTFRTTGPLFRMKRFMQEVVSGKEVNPCRLRDGDDLQDVCQLLNQVTESVRDGSLSLGAQVTGEVTSESQQAA